MKRPEISSGEIAKGKDFKSVLEQLKAKPAVKPFYKNGWFLAGIAGAIVLVTTLLVMNSRYAGEQESKYAGEQENRYAGEHEGSKDKDRRFIRPPFEDLQIPFENYTIKMGKESKVKTQRGSVLSFPKGTLKDEHGNAVKGEVEVRVREFHDPVDFFLSGIPMTYDSAGQHYHFESAGMIEVYAFQGGKVLKIDPGKPVKVEMVTNDPGGNYNVYQLDTSGKNWVYNGRDLLKKDEEKGTQESNDTTTAPLLPGKYENQLGDLNQEIQTLQKDIIQLENTRPLEPKRSTPGRYTFNIEVSKKEFPELLVYKDVLWEVLPENKDFTEAMYKITWDDAVIKEGEQRGQYIVTLKKGSLKKQVSVIPVFEGKDFESAKTLFDSKMKEYSQKLDMKKQEEKKKKDAHDALLKKAGLEFQKQQEENKKLMEKYKEGQQRSDEQMQKLIEENQKMIDQYNGERQLQTDIYNLRSGVMRCFTIASFGIWNCDNPHLEYATVIQAVLNSASGQRIDETDVCIVNLRYNGLITNWVPEKMTLKTKIAPGNNLAWTISRDKKLLVCNTDAFAKGLSIKGEKGYYHLDFAEAPVEINSTAEIKKYLFETASLK